MWYHYTITIEKINKNTQIHSEGFDHVKKNKWSNPEFIKSEEYKVYVEAAKNNIVLDSIETEGELIKKILVVAENKDKPTVGEIPVFRGARSNWFDTTSYAERIRTPSGAVEASNPEVSAAVNTLVQNPTYFNLLEYAEVAKKYADKSQCKDIDRDIEDIEKLVLKDGVSIFQELIFKTISRNGGTFDTHIAPFFSASFRGEEAAGYGDDGALVIYGLEPSQFETISTGGEVMIKAGVGIDSIRGIIPLKNYFDKKEELLENNPEAVQDLKITFQNELKNALEKVGFIPEDVEKLIDTYEQNREKRKQLFKLQSLKDASDIEIAISNRILKDNPQTGLTLAELIALKKRENKYNLPTIARREVMKKLIVTLAEVSKKNIEFWQEFYMPQGDSIDINDSHIEKIKRKINSYYEE